MKAEAEKYADEDKKAKETADALNKGDNIIFIQERMLEEQKDNIKEDEKERLQELVNGLKEAVKDKDVAKIGELEKSINEVWTKISQRIYSQGMQQNANTQNNETVSNDNVQDAEFTEVK